MADAEGKENFMRELIERIEKYLSSDASRHECMPMCREDCLLCLEALKFESEAQETEKENVSKATNTDNNIGLAEFAASLDGIEYLVVFGYSDDGIEFRGAICDELGAYDGGTFHIGKDGSVSAKGISEWYVMAAWYGKTNGKRVYSPLQILDDEGELIPWTYETNIPHAEFMMYEDGDPYCRGIVFSMDSIRDGGPAADKSSVAAAESGSAE